jgi:hypothetical protein
MSDGKRSCEERIADELAQTEDWLAKTYLKIDEANDKGDDALEDQLREEIEPYGASLTYMLRLELSGGGPASWLEVGLDKATWGTKSHRSSITC